MTVFKVFSTLSWLHSCGLYKVNWLVLSIWCISHCHCSLIHWLDQLAYTGSSEQKLVVCYRDQYIESGSIHQSQGFDCTWYVFIGRQITHFRQIGVDHYVCKISNSVAWSINSQFFTQVFLNLCCILCLWWWLRVRWLGFPVWSPPVLPLQSLGNSTKEQYPYRQRGNT